MNQRIKELENRAYAEVTELVMDRTSGYGRLETYVTFSREKFAELIVRECARLADNSQQYIDGREILEHFGVE